MPGRGTRVKDSIIPVLSRPAWPMPGWMPGGLLLIFAVTIGPVLGAPFRPLFLLGCGAAGWYAWRSGPSAHLQTALLLFAFTPLARRIVDVSAGHDQTGFMLVGPLLAILAPFPEVRSILNNRNAVAGRFAGVLLSRDVLPMRPRCPCFKVIG